MHLPRVGVVHKWVILFSTQKKRLPKLHPHNGGETSEALMLKLILKSDYKLRVWSCRTSAVWGRPPVITAWTLSIRRLTATGRIRLLCSFGIWSWAQFRFIACWIEAKGLLTGIVHRKECFQRVIFLTLYRRPCFFFREAVYIIQFCNILQTCICNHAQHKNSARP